MDEPSLGEVLELGCGTGYFTKAIAKNAKHVIATDLSDEMLKITRTQLRGFRNVAVQKADCANTRFPAERFDSVFMANLIHVVETPTRCLQESHRVLRDGGLLVAIDFTGHAMSLLRKMKLAFRYLRKWGLPPRHGRNDLSPDELASFVESTGFRIQGLQLIEEGSNALYMKARKRCTPASST